MLRGSNDRIIENKNYIINLLILNEKDYSGGNKNLVNMNN